MRLAACVLAAVLPLAALAEDAPPGQLAPGPYFAFMICGDARVNTEVYVLPEARAADEARPDALVIMDGRTADPAVGVGRMMFEAMIRPEGGGHALLATRWLYGVERPEAAMLFLPTGPRPGLVARGWRVNRFHGPVVGLPGCANIGMNPAPNDEGNAWAFERYDRMVSDVDGFERDLVRDWNLWLLYRGVIADRF